MASQQPTSTPAQSGLRTALAGLIGNVLEWFDFAVYGYFSASVRAQLAASCWASSATASDAVRC